MNEVVKIGIPVRPETAQALSDARRMRAVGRMVDHLVDRLARPVQGGDPLETLLETTRRSACEAGLTDEDIDAELAAYRAERRG